MKMTTSPKEPPLHKEPPAAAPLTSKTPASKTPACFHDLDFWRFVLAALSLAWEIAKTWVR